jgi:hypothetical protein
MGVHYVNLSLLEGPIDPTNPQALIYMFPSFSGVDREDREADSACPVSVIQFLECSSPGSNRTGRGHEQRASNFLRDPTPDR